MSGNDREQAHRRALAEELRDAGLRSTTARIAVLDAVRRARSPLTHAEVVERLEPIGCDAATVYRNLATLTDAGLIVRSDRGDRLWRFEPADRRLEHGHPHFICTDCGTERCLPDVEVRVRQTASLPVSARNGQFDVRLRGVCDRCSTA